MAKIPERLEELDVRLRKTKALKAAMKLNNSESLNEQLIMDGIIYRIRCLVRCGKAFSCLGSSQQGMMMMMMK